jgi:hypothetical protein
LWLCEVANFVTDYFLSKIKLLSENKRELTTNFVILTIGCCLTKRDKQFAETPTCRKKISYKFFCCHFTVCLLSLQVTVSGLAKVAIFTTNVVAKNQCLINHKCVCGALNRHFCQTRVISRFFCPHSSFVLVVAGVK